MKNLLKNLSEKLIMAYVFFLGGWVIFALSFQCFFIYLHFTGQDERAGRITNEITWKIDGTFKNDPNNIWYEESKK